MPEHFNKSCRCLGVGGKLIFISWFTSTPRFPRTYRRKIMLFTEFDVNALKLIGAAIIFPMAFSFVMGRFGKSIATTNTRYFVVEVWLAIEMSITFAAMFIPIFITLSVNTDPVAIYLCIAFYVMGYFLGMLWPWSELGKTVES